MAFVIATLKIMPESPEIDLEALEIKVKEAIKEFAGDRKMESKIEPVAFGLQSLSIIFLMEESQGSPDPIAEKVADFGGVSSAEIVDVSRALG